MKRKEINIIIKLNVLIIAAALLGSGIQAQAVGEHPQPTPPYPSGMSVRDTMLYHLFDNYPYDTKKPFAAQYPRVALTIITAPPNHSEGRQFEYAGGSLPKYGCWTLRAKVWSSTRQSQTVGPFHWCSPQDLPKDFLPENRITIVPCDGCGPILVEKNAPTGSALAAQKSIRNRTTYVAGASGAQLAYYMDHSQSFAVGDDTTGTQRTDGPVPPNLLIPTDPATNRYYASNTGGFDFGTNDAAMVMLMLYTMDFDLSNPQDRRVWIVRYIPATSDAQPAPPEGLPSPTNPAVSSNVQPAPPSAPSNPMNPTPPSPPAPQSAEPLASIWQSDAYAGQTFRFKLEGDAIFVYGEQQQLLGTLQAKEKKGAIDVYQGLVQIAPVTQCPGGRGLMQIKSWNENRLDAKIETPVNGADGTTCGGVLGSGRLIPWQKVTFVKR